MRKFILTFVSMMLIASPATSQESLMSRLAQVEQNNNMILSTLTAHKAQLDSIKDDLSTIKAELAAIKNASGIKLSSVNNWAGDVQFTAAMPGAMQARPMSSMSYGNSMMSYGSSSRKGLFSGRLLGRGGCASGS